MNILLEQLNFVDLEQLTFVYFYSLVGQFMTKCYHHRRWTISEPSKAQCLLFAGSVVTLRSYQHVQISMKRVVSREKLCNVWKDYQSVEMLCI